VNPIRSEYYLADRSNAGIDIINTNTLTFQRTIGGFVGVKLNPNGTVNNNISGPDGVTSHGRWLYAGDGDSTLKVIDLSPSSSNMPIKQSINTGGTTRVDEMALNTDGTRLLAANNAEDPPFATLFRAKGGAPVSSTAILSKVQISNAIVPSCAGLSIEQPAWEPSTARFYVSVPVIANNPTGCNFGQVAGAPITCDGGLLVVNPATLTPGTNIIGAFDPTTNTGVVPLHRCGPNGATVGPNQVLLLGCTPQNNPSNTETLVISAVNKNQTLIGNITGSDEVWFNEGDFRYYTGSSRACGTPGTCPAPPTFPGFASLGVIDFTSVLIEKIPQSSNSHSVAADSKRNLIFVPQVAPASVVGAGGDITTVGAGICGSNSGCVGVYKSGAPKGNGDDGNNGNDGNANNGNNGNGKGNGKG